jgi:hypothetical protein
LATHLVLVVEIPVSLVPLLPVLVVSLPLVFNLIGIAREGLSGSGMKRGNAPDKETGLAVSHCPS